MSRKPRRRSPKSLPFAVEPLEARWVMAASLSLTGPSDVVYEGQQAQLTLTLSERSRLPEAVEIRTTAASATQGYDYIHHTRRVTFFPGETSKTISISTLRDAGRELVEGIETFQVIATPVNAALGTRTATVKIADYVPPPAFEITVNYLTDSLHGQVTAKVKAAVGQAVTRWQSVISGDLPSFVNPYNGQYVDDFVLDVRMGLLGVPGGTDPRFLANAGPLFGATSDNLGEVAIRPNSRLPYWGTIGFDPADAEQDSADDLYRTALHEIAHALGFAGFVFDIPTPDYPAGLVVDKQTVPRFIGRNAVREFNAIFSTNATGVLIEVEGGQGTAGSHWEDSVLPNELMNGARGQSPPLSKVTVGAMADLGYTVNYDAADLYAPRANAAQPAAVNASAPGGNSVPSPLVPAQPERVTEATRPPPSSNGPIIAVPREHISVPRKLPTRLTFPDRAPIILVDELREAVAASLSTTDGPINLRGISEVQRSMLFAWAAYGKATAPDLFSAIASESTDTRRATHGPILVS